MENNKSMNEAVQRKTKSLSEKYNAIKEYIEKNYIELYKREILGYYKKGVYSDISNRIKDIDNDGYDNWINELKEIFENDFKHSCQIIPTGLYNLEDKKERNKLYDTILEKAKKGIKLGFYSPNLEVFSKEQQEKLKKIFEVELLKNIFKMDIENRWIYSNLKYEHDLLDDIFDKDMKIKAFEAIDTSYNYNDLYQDHGDDSKVSSNADDLLRESKIVLQRFKQMHIQRIFTTQLDVWLQNASSKYMDELSLSLLNNLLLDSNEFDMELINEHNEELEFVKQDINMMLYVLEVFGDLSKLISDENEVIGYVNKYLPENGKVNLITEDELYDYIKKLDISQINDVEDMIRIKRIISNKLAHGYLDKYIYNYLLAGIDIEKKDSTDVFFINIQKNFVNEVMSLIGDEIIDDVENIEEVLNKESEVLANKIYKFSRYYSKLKNVEKLEEKLNEKLGDDLQKCINIFVNPTKNQLKKCAFLKTIVNANEKQVLESQDFNILHKIKVVNSILKKLKDDEKDSLKEFLDISQLLVLPKEYNDVINGKKNLKDKFKNEIIIPLKKCVLTAKLMCDILDNTGEQTYKNNVDEILDKDVIEYGDIKNSDVVNFLKNNKDTFLESILDEDKKIIRQDIEKLLRSNNVMNDLVILKKTSEEELNENLKQFAQGADGIEILKADSVEKYCLEIIKRIKEDIDRYRKLIDKETKDSERESESKSRSSFYEIFQKMLKDADELPIDCIETRKKRIIIDFSDLFVEVRKSNLFRDCASMFDEVIHQYSLVENMFQIKNKSTQLMLAIAGNNDLKYFIEGKKPTIEETGFFDIYTNNIPQTNSCHCKWWEVDLNNEIKIPPRVEELEELYKAKPGELSLNTYIPWPRLTEEQIKGFEELLEIVKKVEQGQAFEKPTDYQATTYDELKKLKIDSPNSFKALKIRTMLGAGINRYKEYYDAILINSNTVEKAMKTGFDKNISYDGVKQIGVSYVSKKSNKDSNQIDK